MHIIVCIDSRGGMSFCGKRQSMDSVLRADILKSASGRLMMNAYSARQFEGNDGITVDEDFLSNAAEDDCCFAENTDIAPYLANAKTVTVYLWNRAYPFDRAFPVADYKERWQLLSSEEFAGSSHKKITKEVYRP